MLEAAKNENEYMTLAEAAEIYADILDEAFYGRKQVEGIQTAMDNIFMKLSTEVEFRIQDSKEAKALEDAVKKAFGFGAVTIYWREFASINSLIVRGKNMFQKPRSSIKSTIPEELLDSYTNIVAESGAYTLPQVRFFNDGNVPKPGTNDKGFYNDRGNIRVAIQLDQYSFVGAKLTSQEAVAILLHEIGHNFDYTAFGIMSSWFNVLAPMISVYDNMTKRFFSRSTATSFALERGFKSLVEYLLRNNIIQQYMPKLLNIDDYIASHIPSIKEIYGTATQIYDDINKLILPIRLAKNAVNSIPDIMYGIYSPMSYFYPLREVQRVLRRKSETFADSFATQYGYGAELGSSLEKLRIQDTVSQYLPINSWAKPFYDMSNLYLELMSFIRGEHQTTQQRFKRAIATLDYDLRDSKLTKADRDAIMKERARIEEAYDQYINSGDMAQFAATSTFRKLIDRWYNGRTYLIVPTLFKDQTYAN